ncbi:MAG: DUF4007 family protein [Gammaproteobacteria bacterium]|nr:DUF4007 family protein [Gammaproteobacteria bacterium]
MKDRVFHSEYVPHFSGHETFHLRYGWLKKAYDAVYSATQQGEDTKRIFSEDEAIARFGVGKNMVAAIRFWSHACGVLEIDDGENATTEFGDLLFSDRGLDPYLENPSSLWLLHWKLASASEKTTFYWAFNHFHDGAFEKDKLKRSISEAAKKMRWKQPNDKTLNSDVLVFLATYAAAEKSQKGSHEDSLASPLTELGLIRNSSRGGYLFGWGPKPSLGNGAFLYALCEFWKKSGRASTVNFQSILWEPGSPGRIFLMDESDLALRLMDIEELSSGLLTWSETAGLKQVIFRKPPTDEQQLEFIKMDYLQNSNVKAA